MLYITTFIIIMTVPIFHGVWHTVDFMRVNNGDGGGDDYDDYQPVSDALENNPLCFVIWNP